MLDLRRWPSAPYTVPFGVLMLLLAVSPYLPVPQTVDYPMRCVVLAMTLWFFSRQVISFRVTRPLASLAIGVAVFLLWIGPDTLFPGYRQHWLFTNAITGQAATTLAPVNQGDRLTLMFRVIRAVVLVPIIEELFWRAWALRWIVRTDFETLPLGSYTRSSFLIVALLFGAEHGPYWEVGLICGLMWNWWMGKTRSLGDLIFTHAVANGSLCAYVLIAKKWEYWM